MVTLALKLLLTPTLIAAASLAGRRWGPVVSGWLVGLPFTSAPVALILTLSHGPAFGAKTALGIMTGTLAVAAFCVAYGLVAPSAGWPASLLAGCTVFAASAAGLDKVALPAIPLFLVVVAGLLVAVRITPRPLTPIAREYVPPSWDIPARMVVATGFVVLLTAIASRLGPTLTGLIAPFPLYAGILAVFAHQLEGWEAGLAVLRGLLLGLFSFATFFLLVATLVTRAGTGVTFGIATLSALVLQAVALWLIRSGHFSAPTQ